MGSRDRQASARRWVRVPANEEPPPYPAGFIVLPRRWVIEIV